MTDRPTEKRRQRNQAILEGIDTRQRKIDASDTVRCILVVCGGVPFIFFLNTTWGHAGLLIYLVTGLLFGVALVSEYPSLGSRFFWMTIISVLAIHTVVVGVLLWVDLTFPDVNRMPRMLYSCATIVLLIEWRVCLRIINAWKAT